MNSLQKLLNALRTLAVHPRSIARVVDDDADKKTHVLKRYGLADGLPAVDLLDLFPGFEETVSPYAFLEGSSTILDIAVLCRLAKQYARCRYLEIGSWRGESLANVARHAGQCVSISLSAEEMRAMGLNDEFIALQRFYSAGLPNVEHIGHNSAAFDYSTIPEPFDLVFVDGDHSYEGVLADTRNVFRLLRDEKSVIVWHDYGHSPETVRWEVLAAILDGCPAENRRFLYHISNTLCAIYTRQPVPAATTRFPQRPNKQFRVSIAAER